MNNNITLIVGGAGLIGSAMVDYLINHYPNKRIRVLGRSALPKNTLPKCVEYLQGNASKSLDVITALKGVTEVVDLAYATVPKTSFDDPLFDVSSNLPASVNLLQLASKANLKRYLLVSSGGTVYGQSKTLTINETHPTDPISPYGISKLLTEKYAIFFHQMAGLPLIIARPSNPYGSNQIGHRVQGFIGAAIGSIQANRPIIIFGERGTIRDYIHVDDLARGLSLCLEKGKISEIYNFGSGLGTDNLRLIELLKSSGFRSDVTVHHEADRPFDVKRNILDSTKAERDLDWCCDIELSQGLRNIWRAL